jgi:hypothetical protein
LPQYIHPFVPGGTFFFSVTLLERRRKLLTEIRTGIYNFEWAQMITFEVQGWDNSKGGMRFAFPPYGLLLVCSVWRFGLPKLLPWWLLSCHDYHGHLPAKAKSVPWPPNLSAAVANRQ